MSEQDLCEVFGKYGPLASIKIMYPRSEEERAKNRHTGFVGFMKRSDAEDAFDGLKGNFENLKQLAFVLSLMGYC